MSQRMKVSHNWIRQQLRYGLDRLLSVIPEGDESVVVMEGEDRKLYWPDDVDSSLWLLVAFTALVNDKRCQGYTWDTIRTMLREGGIDNVMRNGPKR